MVADLPDGVPPVVRPDLSAGRLELLDQTLLPGAVEYVALDSVEEVAAAIRELRVRGAPAIGIVGALGFALGVTHAWKAGLLAGGEAARTEGRRVFETLLAARPTGRNLGWALHRVSSAFETALATSIEGAVEAAAEAAQGVWRDEARRCRRIGEAGLEVIPDGPVSVYTHCNAGSLATGGIGTATAPIYLATERGAPLKVFAGETRPVLQGARLTAWELSRAGIDVTVVTDSMAASLMAGGSVNLIVVGADAVTLDGSVANKIGTYGLAVLARHHGIPFYVALPSSTIEPSLAMDEVPIEARDVAEVTTFGGIRTVPDGVEVWNPAFDVTPPELVTAFLTDAGVVRPPYEPRLSALAPT